MGMHPAFAAPQLISTPYHRIAPGSLFSDAEAGED